MDVIASLMNGILVALEPINLGLAIVGVIVGLFVGAMPGLGSVNGVAILLPFTFVIQGFTGGATSPMIFLASIYYGAMYGGAISSITLGIPGASTAVATTFDGRPLALAGKAHIALVAAALASFAGGTVSNVMFTALHPCWRQLLYLLVIQRSLHLCCSHLRLLLGLAVMIFLRQSFRFVSVSFWRRLGLILSQGNRV